MSNTEIDSPRQKTRPASPPSSPEQTAEGNAGDLNERAQPLEQSSSKTNKHETGTDASKTQQRLMELEVALDRRDGRARQLALLELAKLEATHKPAAQALERYITEHPGNSGIARRQVDLARAAAIGGDDGVLKLTEKSALKLTRSSVTPRDRLDSSLDMVTAVDTLTPSGNQRLRKTFTIAQTLDLADELRDKFNHPLEFQENLRVLSALQKNNPQAKALLDKLTEGTDHDVQRLMLDLTDPAKVEALKVKINQFIAGGEQSLSQAVIELRQAQPKPQDESDKPQFLDAKGKAIDLERVDASTPVMAVSSRDSVIVCQQFASAKDAKSGLPPLSVTELSHDATANIFQVKTTDGQKRVETIRFDENGIATSYEMTAGGTTSTGVLADGHLINAKVAGKDVSASQLKALLPAVELSIAMAHQKLGLHEALKDPLEHLRLTEPREGLNATGRPTGTIVWRDPGEQLQSAKVENGQIKDANGGTLGTVNDLGEVKLANQAPFKINEKDGSAFHGIASDGGRLDLASKITVQNAFNGELTSADGKQKYSVIANNIFDNKGHLIGTLSENGVIERPLKDGATSYSAINTLFDGGTFEGEQGDKKRIFSVSSETVCGTIHIPVDGKQVEFSVSMGMVIDKKSGEQCGWLTPPRLSVDGKLDGGTFSRLTSNGVQDIPLAAIKNASFDLQLLGITGVDGSAIRGISLGARTQADGSLAPGQGFFNVTEAIELERTRSETARKAQIEQRERGTSGDWRWHTGAQDADWQAQEVIKEAATKNIEKYKEALSSGQLDQAKVDRLRSMKEGTEVTLSSALKVKREQLNAAGASLEALPDETRLINGTVQLKTHGENKQSELKTYNIKNGVISDAQGHELGRIRSNDGRLELNNNEQVRALFSADAARELAARHGGEPLTVEMKMLAGAHWRLSTDGAPFKANDPRNIDWISLGQSGIASRGNLLHRGHGELLYASLVDKEADSQKSQELLAETRRKLSVYEQKINSIFTLGIGSDADLKYLAAGASNMRLDSNKSEQPAAPSRIALVPLDSEAKTETVNGKLRIGSVVYDIRNGELYKHASKDGKNVVETESAGKLLPNYKISLTSMNERGEQQANTRVVSLSDQNRVLMEFTVGAEKESHRVLGLGLSRRSVNQGIISGGLVDVRELDNQAQTHIEHARAGRTDYIKSTPYVTGVLGEMALENRSELLGRFVKEMQHNSKMLKSSVNDLFSQGFDTNKLENERFNSYALYTQAVMHGLNTQAADTNFLSQQGKQIQSQISDGVTIAAITFATAGVGTAFSGLANASKVAALGRLGRVGMFAAQLGTGALVGGTTSTILRASDTSSGVANFKAGAIEGGLMVLGSASGKAMGIGTTVKESRQIIALARTGAQLTAEQQALLTAVNASVTGRLLAMGGERAALTARAGYHVTKSAINAYGFNAAGNVRQGKELLGSMEEASTHIGIATNLVGDFLGQRFSGLMRNQVAREVVENIFSSGTSGTLDALKPQMDEQDLLTAERLGIPVEMLSEATKHKYRDYGAILEKAMETGSISTISAPFTTVMTHGTTKLIGHVGRAATRTPATHAADLHATARPAEVLSPSASNPTTTIADASDTQTDHGEKPAAQRRRVRRDIENDNADAGEKPPVRTYRVVEGQDVIERFRSGALSSVAGMILVQEHLPDGQTGPVQKLYLEHRTGPDIDFGRAADADLVATCDPGSLPESLRGKFPLRDTSGAVFVSLSDGSSGGSDDLRLSTQDSITACAVEHNHTTLRLGALGNSGDEGEIPTVEQLIPEALRKQVPRRVLGEVDDFLTSSEDPHAAARLIKGEVERGAKASELNYERLTALEELVNYFPYDSDNMRQLLKVESCDDVNITKLVNFILDGNAEARAELIAHELQRCRTEGIFSIDRMQALDLLSTNLGPHSKAFEIIQRYDDDGSLNLQRISDFLESDPAGRAKLIADQVARGATAQQLSVSYLTPLETLTSKLSDHPEILQRILDMDSSDMRLRTVAQFLSARPTVGTRILVNEIEHGASGEQLTSPRLNALVTLSKHFADDSPQMLALRNFAHDPRFSLESAAAFLNGENPKERAALLTKEIERGARGSQLEFDRMDALFRLDKFFDGSAKTMDKLLAGESGAGLKLESLLDFITEAQNEDGECRRAFLVAAEINRGATGEQMSEGRLDLLVEICEQIPYTSQTMKELLRIEGEGNRAIVYEAWQALQAKDFPNMPELIESEVQRFAKLNRSPGPQFFDLDRLIGLSQQENKFDSATLSEILDREAEGLDLAAFYRFISKGGFSDSRKAQGLQIIRSLASDSSDAHKTEVNQFLINAAYEDKQWVNTLLAEPNFSSLPLATQSALVLLRPENVTLRSNGRVKDHNLPNGVRLNGDLHLTDLSTSLNAWQLCPSMPQELAARVGALSPLERLVAGAAYGRAQRVATDYDSGRLDSKKVQESMDTQINVWQTRIREGSMSRNEVLQEMWKEFKFDPDSYHALGSKPNKQGRREFLRLVADELLGQTAFKSKEFASRELAYALSESAMADDPINFMRLMKAGEFPKIIEALSAISPEKSDSSLGLDAMQLVLVLGGRGRDWVNSRAKGSDSPLFDVTQPVRSIPWTPQESAIDAAKAGAAETPAVTLAEHLKKLSELGPWLMQNKEAKGRHLQIIAGRWCELSPEEKKLPRAELLKLCLAKDYPDALDPSFAAEAANMGGNSGWSKTEYKEAEKRFLDSQKVPLPFPTHDASGKNVEWNSGKLKGRFLERSDTRGLFLGEYTNSCQHPGGEAASSAWHGQESPDGGFFVVEDDKGEIVAMSWAWRSPEGGLCFDNCEAKGLGSRQSDTQRVYESAARELCEKYAFHTVTLGVAHSKLRLRRWPKANRNERLQLPPDASYSDADKQVVLAHLEPVEFMPDEFYDP